MSEDTTLYAVTGPSDPGDRPCVLIDGNTGEFIFRHISSSKNWALADVTSSFGRKYDLRRLYPEGYDVIEVAGWAGLPAIVRHRADEWVQANLISEAPADD